MKPSGIEWIGDIPDDWEVTKIGQLYLERNEKVSDREYEALSVTKHGILKQLESAAKTDNGDNRKLVKSGDFVINSRSDRRGSCGISKFDGSVSLINIILMPTKKIANDYYNYLFRTENFADEFYKYGNGIVDDLWSTKWTSMKKILVPFPPLKTQRKIADYLDEECREIDATIAKQKESIEKLKAYKQSLISETVTKGLDKSAPLKPSGIDYLGDIPSHWEIRKLKYVAKLDPTISEFLRDNDIVSFAPMECLGEQTLSPYETEYGKVKGKYTYFANEDIIMAKVTPCFENGNIAIAKNLKNNVGFGSSELFVFRAKNISNSFLMYSLYSEPFKSLAKSTMYGTGGLKRVSPNFILNYKIPLPPLKTQESIADYLDSKCSQIDKYITEKQNIIQKLDAYKKSLIFECVTGKQIT